ncbi:MAG: LPS export ABC transporter periplasmic protein LptC [Gammaproteobacteria bacterium]|nr:LPS export ABC transporter periplasmic protein LptC [Gammaproteobacteria bacterium]
MIRRRTWVALSLCLAGAALLYQLQRQQPSFPAKAQPLNLPRYTVIDAQWTRYGEDGMPSLTGHAAEVEYFDDGSGRARDLQLTALGFHGAPWVLTAPAAWLPAGTDEAKLLGRVQLDGRWPDDGEPLQLLTQDLWLNPGARRLHGDAPLTVTSPHRSGSAVGVRGDWGSQDLELLSDVRMHYDTGSQ